MLRENTVNGQGNMYSTEFRMFDARLGRWMSLDPLMDQFPWMSPFVGMDNNPISLVDPLGLNTIGDGGGNGGGNFTRNFEANERKPREGGIYNPKGKISFKNKVKAKFRDSWMRIGQLAHTAIEAIATQGGTSEEWKNERVMIDVNQGTDPNLRPDLTYSDGNKGGIWEIKPKSYEAKNSEYLNNRAKNQVSRYVNRANNIEYRGHKNWAPGVQNGSPMPLLPPIGAPIKMGEYTFAITSIDAWNGLIFYEILDGPRQKEPALNPVKQKKPAPEPYFLPIVTTIGETTVKVTEVVTRTLMPIIIIQPNNNCLTCPQQNFQ